MARNAYQPSAPRGNGCLQIAALIAHYIREPKKEARNVVQTNAQINRYSRKMELVSNVNPIQRRNRLANVGLIGVTAQKSYFKMAPAPLAPAGPSHREISETVIT